MDSINAIVANDAFHNNSVYIFLSTLFVAFFTYVLIILVGTNFNFTTFTYQLSKLFKMIFGYTNTSNLHLYMPLIIFSIIVVIYELIVNREDFLVFLLNGLIVFWNLIVDTFQRIHSSKWWILLFVVISLLVSIFYWWLRKKFNILGSHDNDFKECTKDIRDILLTRNHKSLIRQVDHKGGSVENYKMRDFYIFTSHNTYCPCLQNLDIGHKDMYIIAMKLGCRVVELDIFQRNFPSSSPGSDDPIIAHGATMKSSDFLTTSPLEFEDCIKNIADYAFKSTDDPLILDCECNFHKNKATADKVATIIEKHFGKQIYWGNSGNVSDKPVSELLGKVIVRTGGGVPSDSKLYKMRTWYGNTSSDWKEKKLPKLVEKVDKGLVRIYPTGDLSGGMSNNFNPSPFWDIGCQLVACNIHIIDENMEKQLEMFKNYSFQLKPQHLLSV